MASITALPRSEIQAAFDAGRSAARNGRHFNTACPYTFERAGVSQQIFAEQYRPLLNAWFDGWHGNAVALPEGGQG